MRNYLIVVLLALVGNITQAQPLIALKLSGVQSGQHSTQVSYTQDKTFKDRTMDVSAIKKYIATLTNPDNMNIYDATHYLMVPLFYAFETRNSELEDSFDGLFSDALIDEVVSGKRGELNSLCFAYLATEYLRLYDVYDETKIYKDRNFSLYTKLRKFILDEWSQSGSLTFFGERYKFIGRRSRIAYIINTDKTNYPTGKEYYGAITDFELFTMAVGASLSAYELHRDGKISSELFELPVYFLNVLKTQTVTTERNGWLLQPGVWKNHPDYKYAGNTTATGVLNKKEVNNIGWDASHFARMPAFLNTLSSLFSPTSPDGKFLAVMKNGLANQFNNYVMTKPSNSNKLYTFNNFMDGTNGIYRYKYKSIPLGYAPGHNTLAVFFGWWKFLDDDDINNMYVDILSNYESYLKSPNFSTKSLSSNSDLYKEIIALK